jgi:cephalosporin-C deacetylase
MAQFDLTGTALTSHRSTAPEPEGFQAFWGATLQETRAAAADPWFAPVDSGLVMVDVLDVTFSGWAGHPIKAWLALPRGAATSTAAELPAVVEFVGYGGGRGLPHTATLFALAGWAHLRMDVRGQGSAWSTSDTPDPGEDGEPAFPGFMTRGILDPATYYYRRVFADAVRAVDTVRAFPAVDPGRVAVTGNSQGGALTIATAGLVPDLVAAAPDVPFLCDIRRAVTMVDTDPYTEVARYCATHRDRVDAALHTLDFVDCVHHAARATVPSLWSVGLMDDTCPPSTVYAAYNAWTGPKRIIEYPFNRHEGGGAFHDAVRLGFLRDRFGG